MPVVTVTVAVQLVPCATTTDDGEHATAVVLAFACVTVKAADVLAPCVSLTAGEYVAVMLRVPVPLMPLYVTEQLLAEDVGDPSVHDAAGVNVPVPPELNVTVPVGAD